MDVGGDTASGFGERRGGGGRNVTFPATQYAQWGTSAFALSRPIADITAQERIRD